MSFDSSIKPIVTVVFFSTGFVGNFISILICLRKQMRKNTTFIFMSFTSLMNVLPMVSIVAISFKLHDLNVSYCNIITILLSIGCQSSIYLIVSIMSKCKFHVLILLFIYDSI
jgi:hypothetical protein